MEEKKKLQINCSPGTFGKIKNDPELVENYSKHFMETQGHFDVIVFAPIVENVEHGLGDSSANEEMFTPLVESPVACSDQSTANLSLWTDSATKLLLDEVNKLWGKVGKSINLKNKSQLWKIIAEKLSKEGYGFSALQVETKFRGLERQYKKAKLNNSQTGRNRMNCVYQSQLDEVFGAKKGINPDCTLESENQDVLRPSQVECSQNSLPSDDGPSTSANARKLTERGKLLQRLDEISAKKEERHQKIIQFLERREERKKKTEEEKQERENRRDEMGKKIIDLLEKV